MIEILNLKREIPGDSLDLEMLRTSGVYAGSWEPVIIDLTQVIINQLCIFNEKYNYFILQKEGGTHMLVRALKQ